MKCYQCGAELPEGQKFCTNCGYRVEEGATTVLDQSNNPFAQQDTNATTVLDQSNNPFVQQPAQPAFEQPAQPTFTQPAQPPVFAYTPPQTQQPVFGNAPQQPMHTRPLVQLPTGRGLLKSIFLGILTLGIYNMVVFCRIPTELNISASRYDGRRTMPFFAMAMVAPLTLFILPFVWYNNLCDRIGNELNRRGCNYKFGASTFWLWGILGSLIIVGPFIYMHKMFKAMNLLSESYNVYG